MKLHKITNIPHIFLFIKESGIMATITIAGGTGMIGTALSNILAEAGHIIYILSRSSKKSNHSNISFSAWDIDKKQIDETVIRHTDILINLSGENIAESKWTDKRKKAIIDSRIKSNQFLSSCINILPNTIRKFISASANGFYGNRPGIKLDENSEPGNGFLSEVCVNWENSVQVIKPDVEVYFMRMGVVLANEGGAFPKITASLPFLVPYFSKGQQIISWIHIEDACKIYKFFAENPTAPGVYNINTPYPVSSKNLAKTIGKVFSGPGIIMSVPKFALKFMLGEMSTTVLNSIDTSADKLTNSGYNFIYPQIENAIMHLSGKTRD